MKLNMQGKWAIAILLPLIGNIGYASNDEGNRKQIDFSAFGSNAGDIGAPSWPLFKGVNEVIKVKKFGTGPNAYWTLTGTGSNASFLGDFSNYVKLGNESVKYVAHFNAAGKLITSIGSGANIKTLTNYLEISGALPAGDFGFTSWTNQPNQLLLKATLLDSNSENGTPDLIGTYSNTALGFKTLFTDGWVAENASITGGSIGENLWLVGFSSEFRKLIRALDGNSNNGTLNSLFNSSSKKIRNVVSIAAVPLPATAWLFGTGIMAFLVGRRNKSGLKFFA
ncbi:MAG: hypothetical protein HOP23_03315 [Methylococcaceae bacterium]|nr:hypothetical protein [Methylococcaceae bacterium]